VPCKQKGHECPRDAIVKKVRVFTDEHWIVISQQRLPCGRDRIARP